MKIEIDNLGGEENRVIEIRRRDDTTLELRAGVRGSPGIAVLSRIQALALSDALKAAARELTD